MFEDQTKASQQQTKVRCPYIRKHKIEPRNLPAHIQKCQKSLPPNILSRFAACKYNSFHIFSSFDIAAHELNCPDRKKMELLQQSLTQKSDAIIQEESSKESLCVNQNASKKAGFQENDLVKIRFSIYEGDSSIREVKLNNKGVLKQGINKKINVNSISSNQSPSQQSDSEPEVVQKQQVAKNKKSKYSSYQQQKNSINQSARHYNGKQQIELKNKNTEERKKSLAKKESNICKNTANDYQRLQLYQCKQCNYLLLNPDAKVWKNKKIVKYLKAYEKLQEEHEEILKYIQVVSHIFSKGKRGFSSSRQNKSELVENKKVDVAQVKINPAEDQDKKIGKQQKFVKENKSSDVNKNTLKQQMKSSLNSCLQNQISNIAQTKKEKETKPQNMNSKYRIYLD